MSPASQIPGLLFATLASISWAAFALVIRNALQNAPVIKTTAIATTLDALCVTMIAAFSVPAASFLPAKREALFFLVLAGILHIGLSRTFYSFALQRIGPSRAVPLALTYPFVTAFLAAFWLEEPLTAFILIGLGLLIFGIFFVVGTQPGRDTPGGQAGKQPGRASGWFAAGMSSLLWGLAGIFFKKAAPDFNPFAAASVALWVGAMTTWLLALTLGRKESAKAIPRRNVKWILFAVLLQAIAFPSYTAAFSGTLAVRVVAIVALVPIFALFMGWLFQRGRENITPRLILGALLTVGGTILIII